MVKGDKVYYCDICPSKKPSRGATPEGAKTAAICHLAIQHHELRGVMEKDERLSKDFINDVYYVSYNQVLKLVFGRASGQNFVF